MFGSFDQGIGLVHTGTQSVRSIFVPISGTDKYAVHTGTERFRTNFVLCSHGNAIVPLTCFPFASLDGNGTERLFIVPQFYHFCSRTIFWNGTVLFETFPSERNPSAFHFLEHHGTKWNDCVPV